MDMSAHVQTTFDCVKAAEECATACINMGDTDSKGHDMTACIKLTRDVADIAGLCGRLCARDSQFMKSYMRVCAEACDACATECEKHADHMDHCKACAEACRKCADECRSMMN